MDKPYTFQRGVSYAEKLSKSSGMEDKVEDFTMASQVASDHFEMTSREREEECGGSETLKEKQSPKLRFSRRKVMSAIIIVMVVAGLVALIVLGVEYFPTSVREEKCPILVVTDNPTTDFEKRCVPTADAIKSITKVKIQSRRRVIEGSVDLTAENSLDIWIFKNSSSLTLFSVEVNVSKATCNDEGVYTFEYFDSLNKIVMNQTKTLRVDGKLSNPIMKMIPHVAEDGKSKAVYLECSMNTGCRHGTLVPELYQNNKVTFIDDASCTYQFTKKHGGAVSCFTYISESVWGLTSKVECLLKPEPEIGIQSMVYTKTSDINIDDACNGGKLTIKENGYIICKKFVSSNSVSIDLYKYGQYVFGGHKQILTAKAGGKEYSSDNRIFMSSVREGDILTVNITFSPVHCSDEGSFSLNFTDGADVQVQVEVIGIQDTCDFSKSVSIDNPNNFEAICAWCPNHQVNNVMVTQMQNAVYNQQNSELIGGSTSAQFPVFVDIKGRTKNTNVTVNLTVTALKEYGLLIVKVERTGIACNYGEFYVFEANDGSGNATKRVIKFLITVPIYKYESEYKVPVFVNNTKVTVKFKGYLGCSPRNLVIKQDDAILITEKYIEKDDQNAKIAKIEREYGPITMDMHDQKISVEVTFESAAGNPTEYKKESKIEVLDNKICAGFTSTIGCNVVHPTKPDRFVACSPANVIQGVTICPSNTLFTAEGCTGKCL